MVLPSRGGGELVSSLMRAQKRIAAIQMKRQWQVHSAYSRVSAMQATAALIALLLLRRR
jgi:hypothetical protein